MRHLSLLAGLLEQELLEPQPPVYQILPASVLCREEQLAEWWPVMEARRELAQQVVESVGAVPED